MKFFFISMIYLLVFGIKFMSTNQLNHLKKIDMKIANIENEIEKLKTDYSYLTSPKYLKNINKNKLNLYPIEQKDIIRLEDQ